MKQKFNFIYNDFDGRVCNWVEKSRIQNVHSKRKKYKGRGENEEKQQDIIYKKILCLKSLFLIIEETNFKVFSFCGFWILLSWNINDMYYLE